MTFSLWFLDEVWKYFIEKFYISVHSSVCFFFSTVVPYLTTTVRSSSSFSVPNHVQIPQFCRFRSGLGGAASSATPTGSHLPKGLFCLNRSSAILWCSSVLPWESLSTRPLKWYPSGAVSIATWKLSRPGLCASQYYPLAARLCLLGKFPIRKRWGNESLWKNWIDFFFKCFVCGFYV